MITVKIENYNLISQDFYNETIDSLDLNLIPCTCGHSGCLIHYGSYKRNVQLKDETITLTIVNASLAYLSAYMGHQSLRETQDYLWLSRELFSSTLARMDDYTSFISDIFDEKAGENDD